MPRRQVLAPSTKTTQSDQHLFHENEIESQLKSNLVNALFSTFLKSQKTRAAKGKPVDLISKSDGDANAESPKDDYESKDIEPVRENLGEILETKTSEDLRLESRLSRTVDKIISSSSSGPSLKSNQAKSSPKDVARSKLDRKSVSEKLKRKRMKAEKSPSVEKTPSPSFITSITDQPIIFSFPDTAFNDAGGEKKSHKHTSKHRSKHKTKHSRSHKKKKKTCSKKKKKLHTSDSSSSSDSDTGDGDSVDTSKTANRPQYAAVPKIATKPDSDTIRTNAELTASETVSLSCLNTPTASTENTTAPSANSQAEKDVGDIPLPVPVRTSAIPLPPPAPSEIPLPPDPVKENPAPMVPRVVAAPFVKPTGSKLVRPSSISNLSSTFKPPVRKPPAENPEPEVSLAPPVKKPAKQIGLKISVSSSTLISSGQMVDNSISVKGFEEGELPGSPKNSGTNQSKSDDEDAADSSPSRANSSASSISSAESGGESPVESTKHRKHKKRKRKQKTEKDVSKTKRSQSRSRTPSPEFMDDRRRRSRSRSADDRRSRSYRYRSRRRSTSPDYTRSQRRDRSRSRRRSRDRSSRYDSRSRDRRSRSRRGDSQHPYYYDRFWGKYRDKERLREHERSAERKERSKVDKRRLRAIAIQRAVVAGNLDALPLRAADRAALAAGGKTMEELTRFCETLAKHDSDSPSDDEPINMPVIDDNIEDDPNIRHPFAKQPAPIVMNIRNSKQLPTLSHQEKSQLRLTFPVSSGEQHNTKTGKDDWVTVEKTVANADVGTAVAMSSFPAPSQPTVYTPVNEEDRVFSDKRFAAKFEAVKVQEVLANRAEATQKLSVNPLDIQALKVVQTANDQMQQWAESKTLPGQFVGSTGVKVLPRDKLEGGLPGWLRKDSLSSAKKIGGIGKVLLQKMGWSEGEGLGRDNAGDVEPLMLDFKVDRKGLSSEGEEFRKKAPTAAKRVSLARDLSGKHPVSALMELCAKQKWGNPMFDLIEDTGPTFHKTFKYKVLCNGVEYMPSVGSSTKKDAKAEAATVVLQSIGLLPRPGASTSAAANKISSTLGEGTSENYAPTGTLKSVSGARWLQLCTADHISL